VKSQGGGGTRGGARGWAAGKGHDVVTMTLRVQPLRPRYNAPLSTPIQQDQRSHVYARAQKRSARPQRKVSRVRQPTVSKQPQVEARRHTRLPHLIVNRDSSSVTEAPTSASYYAVLMAACWPLAAFKVTVTGTRRAVQAGGTGGKTVFGCRKMCSLFRANSSVGIFPTPQQYLASIDTLLEHPHPIPVPLHPRVIPLK
jgi:hypothetical protein